MLFLILVLVISIFLNIMLIKMESKSNHFEKEAYKLSHTYGVTKDHANCFLCNYKDSYICNKYNGGCESLEKCKEIYEKENGK